MGTSSLTSVVLANVKTTLIIVIAVLLWDKAISPMSIVGFGIFFGGLFGYSYLTFKSRQSGTTKPAEPVKETTKLVSWGTSVEHRQGQGERGLVESLCCFMMRRRVVRCTV